MNNFTKFTIASIRSADAVTLNTIVADALHSGHQAAGPNTVELAANRRIRRRARRARQGVGTLFELRQRRARRALRIKSTVLAAGPRRQNGVTLIELVISLAIVAITVGIGMPSLQKFIASNRVTAQANTLLGALSIARSEAIKRNNLVVVARTGNNWQDGWFIFVDANMNDSFDPGLANPNEVQIQTYEAVSSGYAIRPNTEFANIAVYRPDGRIRISNGNTDNPPGSFYVCSPASDADFRRVTVASTGRVHVDTPASLGISYNSNLTCG